MAQHEPDQKPHLDLPLEPGLYQGGLAVDDRGQLTFCNDFDFLGVKRFYIVSNHRQGFIRAWHAHRHEALYVTALQGSVLIGCVKVDDWEKPSQSATVNRLVLSSAKPQVYYIPPGYANGSMSLTCDAIVQYFSTATMAQGAADDVRFDARHWDIWQIQNR